MLGACLKVGVPDLENTENEEDNKNPNKILRQDFTRCLIQAEPGALLLLILNVPSEEFTIGKFGDVRAEQVREEQPADLLVRIEAPVVLPALGRRKLHMCPRFL